MPQAVNWTDGTCILISRKTLKTVGFLDPSLRAPGWGSDVDYCYRAFKPGLELYVSRRAMLWHHADMGGRSATKVYGDRSQWIASADYSRVCDDGVWAVAYRTWMAELSVEPWSRRKAPFPPNRL